MEAVLKDLRGHGWRPIIATSWRDPAEQAQKYKQGLSKVRWGFHCFTRSGKPSALAADIVDSRYLWGIPQSHEFWRDLGSSAKAHGLGWGGDWKWRDVGHVEVKGLSVSQARKAST